MTILELGIDTNPQLPSSTSIGKWEGIPRAYTPPAIWFPESTHALAAKDIATPWPEAELEQLSLFVGRALVGPTNSFTPSGCLISHTFQGCALTVCKDASLGQSFFLEALLSTLQKVGYRVETLGSMNSVSTADIIYENDLTPRSLARFLRSETARAIITGSNELTGVVFLNLDFDPLDHGIDLGTTGLFKVITTHSKSALDELKVCGSPSAHPRDHITHLAKQRDLDPHTVMLWFARLCVDKFFESIKPTL